MAEPRWLSRTLLDLIHSELLAEHGGAPGIRGGGDDLIEAALVRPQHRFAYDAAADLPSLAAAYLFGLTKNHGYVDGNKRVGFAAAATFLYLNGFRLTAPEVEAYEIVIGLVENRYSEDDVRAWFRRYAEPISGA
jgi:death-on-curing protein